MRSFTLILSALLAAAALAGCTDNGDTTPTPATQAPPTTSPSDPFATPTPASPTTPVVTPTPPTEDETLNASTYALEVVGMPSQVKAGAKFNFTLYANGTMTNESDHIGAHYADNATTNPPGTGRRDCEHVAGSLPGMFLVNCTIHDVGAWHVWGHARGNDSGELWNWWTSAASLVNVRAYNLSLSGVPTAPQASGANFTFTLNITGSENATSDHIGAHFWNATEQNPTVQNSAGLCPHLPTATGALGNHQVTCAIEHRSVGTGQYFVRGHLRITEGASVLSWWTDEATVTVVGNPLA